MRPAKKASRLPRICSYIREARDSCFLLALARQFLRETKRLWAAGGYTKVEQVKNSNQPTLPENCRAFAQIKNVLFRILISESIRFNTPEAARFSSALRPFFRPGQRVGRSSHLSLVKFASPTYILAWRRFKR